MESSIIAPKTLNLKELTELVQTQAAAIEALQARVTELEKPKTSASDREMTDDDARRILTGDLKDAKHKDAAAKLGLSYGQIYSCRGEYTFKHIHKELKTAGFKNGWVKA